MRMASVVGRPSRMRRQFSRIGMRFPDQKWVHKDKMRSSMWMTRCPLCPPADQRQHQGKQPGIEEMQGY